MLNRLGAADFTHRGRVTHICVVKLTIFGSDNVLSPERRQAIILTNAGILLIGPLGTNFIEILIWIQTFSFKKMHLKMSSAKWRPFCLGLNVLTNVGPIHTSHMGIAEQIWDARNVLISIIQQMGICLQSIASPIDALVFFVSRNALWLKVHTTATTLTIVYSIAYWLDGTFIIAIKFWHRKVSDIRAPNPKPWMIVVSSCSCLCPTYWNLC